MPVTGRDRGALDRFQLLQGGRMGAGARRAPRRRELLVKDDIAVVELRSLATAKNGFRFDNNYCWLVWFDENRVITKVRAYFDSAIVAELFRQNPI